MFNLPLKIASIMRDFEPDWFIAGGWAIDLYLEKETRTHDDIEIAIFRRDQIALQNYLFDWQLQKVSGGKLFDWRPGEFLNLPVHEVRGFNNNSEPPQLEILLNEAKKSEWVFRRNKKITRPLNKCCLTSTDGIKFLAPEIVLLYKSKSPRTKDEQDFEAAVAHLDSERREWLKHALTICSPKHHWQKALRNL